MVKMAQRYKTEEAEEKEFRLRVRMGQSVADKFDLVEALQRVVEAVERGRQGGPVVDAEGAKVGEFAIV